MIESETNFIFYNDAALDLLNQLQQNLADKNWVVWRIYI